MEIDIRAQKTTYKLNYGGIEHVIINLSTISTSSREFKSFCALQSIKAHWLSFLILPCHLV